MSTILYTDANTGYKYAVIAPANTVEHLDKYPYYSPPDLSGLGLVEEMQKRLHNALVEAGMFVAPLVKRAKLKQILTELGLPTSYVRRLLVLFQGSYYGEM